MEEIILASASPRRSELLSLIGVPFKVIVSEADESVQEEEPEKIVMELAYRKASAVAALPEAAGKVVLGADTIVWCDGEVLGKPKDAADADRMLHMLQGHVHSVYTGAAILQRSADSGADQCRQFYRCTKVHVHEMTQDEIDAYIATGEPFDKAGAYGIQGPFAAYVDGIEGDYQTVVGLPVSAVYQELKDFSGDVLCRMII